MKRKRRGRVGLWLLAAAAMALLIWVWRSFPIGSEHEGLQSNQRVPPIQPAKQIPELETNQQSPFVSNQAANQAPVPAPPAKNSLAPTEAPAATSADAQPAGSYPRQVRNVFELQLALARQALSPGSLDGAIGPQTRSALARFQWKQHLPITGELDNTTRQILLLSNAPTIAYVITSNDVSRLQPLSATWLGKSQQTALEYESVLEMVAEKAQSSPGLIRRLNPGRDWSAVEAGSSIELPNVNLPTPAQRSAYLTIRLGEKVLEAWDEHTNLLAHFPCSIARLMEKRPVGELHVEVIAPHPNYTFDPSNFPESPEAQTLKTKLVLPPGPNNPVGVAWIGLDKAGYGIHGTPQPEQVGHTESHGCFRLANWNVEYLVRLVTIGTPVRVEP